MVDRQLDLQLYLLLNGYTLKEIPEERYVDYMREPHYTKDADYMIHLLGTMVSKGIDFQIMNIGDNFSVKFSNKDLSRQGEGESISLPMAVSLAVYNFYTGVSWK